MLVLSGGRGQRLEPLRKRISASVLQSLSHYDGQEGPKGLAMLNMRGHNRPLLDWHLSIYSANAGIKRIFLGLGFSGDMIQDYYTAQGSSFAGVPLFFLREKRPAGTIAPLVKLKQQYGWPKGPLLLSNGDNLLNMDFASVYQDILHYPGLDKEQISSMVFDVVASVPHRESGSYGVVDLDESGYFARRFLEKQDWQKNPYLEIDGCKCSYVNSGFSLIPNPQKAFLEYLIPEIEEMVQALESGTADYESNEKFVKYETIYEKMAADGCLGVVKYDGFWADSGSEAQILQIEQDTNAGKGLQTTPPKIDIMRALNSPIV